MSANEHSLESLQGELHGSDLLPPLFGHGLVCICEHVKHQETKLTCGFCTQHRRSREQLREQQQQAGEVNMTDQEAFVVRRFRETDSTETIKEQLYLLHAATGHGSTRSLVQSLQRRGARTFERSFCQERQKRKPHRVASLDPKMCVVSVDEGKWTHPVTNEEFVFLLCIDGEARETSNDVGCLVYAVFPGTLDSVFWAGAPGFAVRSLRSTSKPLEVIPGPGDLVYFWRKQVKNAGVGKNGTFLGPARILCAETRREPGGQCERKTPPQMQPRTTTTSITQRRAVRAPDN